MSVIGPLYEQINIIGQVHAQGCIKGYGFFFKIKIHELQCATQVNL